MEKNMELEQMSTAELIALVKRQEQELAAQPMQQPAPAHAVHQFRTAGASDWYDGHPDSEDGGGPYEVRILYAAPVAAPVDVPAASVHPESSRERFEAHIKERNPAASLDRHPSLRHLYALAWVNEAWIAWRRAVSEQPDSWRDAALVEAAKLIEQYQETNVVNGEYGETNQRIVTPRKANNLAGLAYADAIRALAAHPANVAQPVSDAALQLLLRLEPHLDALVCYASTTSEYEPNKLVQEVRALLAAPGAVQVGEPVAYSVTYQGEHPGNFFKSKEHAQAKLKRLNNAYPDEDDSREIIALYTRPQPALDVAQVGELSGAELEFIGAVLKSPGRKLGDEAFDSEHTATWKRPEEYGLVKCVGSYKWVPCYPFSQMVSILAAAKKGGE